MPSVRIVTHAEYANLAWHIGQLASRAVDFLPTLTAKAFSCLHSGQWAKSVFAMSETVIEAPLTVKHELRNILRGNL